MNNNRGGYAADSGLPWPSRLDSKLKQPRLRRGWFNPVENTPTALNFGLMRKAIARASDTVARVGGDEFVLILESLKGKEDIPSIQEKLYRCCHDEVLLDDGQRIPISISVGLALYPDDTQDIKTLFIMADKAMYLDKAASRAGHMSPP